MTSLDPRSTALPSTPSASIESSEPAWDAAFDESPAEGPVSGALPPIKPLTSSIERDDIDSLDDLDEMDGWALGPDVSSDWDEEGEEDAGEVATVLAPRDLAQPALDEALPAVTPQGVVARQRRLDQPLQVPTSLPASATARAPLARIPEYVMQQFAEDFETEDLLHLHNLAQKCLARLSIGKAYFRENEILRKTMEKAQTEMAEVVEHPKFDALLKAVVAALPLLAIGDSGYVTTSEIAEREKYLLALSGFETDDHVLNTSVVEAAIARKVGISDEQKAAVEASCLSHRRVTVIEGTAGAGKSFTMQATKEAYADSGYDVIGTALGWNAAKVLESSAGLSDCKALAGLLQEMQQARDAGIQYFKRSTLIIVDEAGMVDTASMHDLLDITHQSEVPIKIVLTGDSLQLNPVAAGNALEAIIAFHGTSRIDNIRRQKQMSHRLAVRRFSQQEAGKALYPFLHQEALQWCKSKDEVMQRVVQDFLSYRLAFPKKKALILALTNKDVVELNQRVRAAYRKMGMVSGPDVEIQVTDGKETWEAFFAVGDEVVVRTNSKHLTVYEIPSDPNNWDVATWKETRVGVFNRNVGRIAGVFRSRNPIGSYDMHIDLTGDLPGRIVLNTQKFRHHEKPAFPVVHNFATTIYASQGQTVQKVMLLDGPRMDFRLAYVGMSRHTDSVDVYFDEEELHQRMRKIVGRQSDDTQQYSRASMLQTVALQWSKASQNMTVMMFDRERRLGRMDKNHAPERASVVRGSSEDPVVDFDDAVLAKPGQTWLNLAEARGITPSARVAWKKDVLTWSGLPQDTCTDDQEVLPMGWRLRLRETSSPSYPMLDVDALMALPDPDVGVVLPSAPREPQSTTASGQPLRARHTHRLPTLSIKDEPMLDPWSASSAVVAIEPVKPVAPSDEPRALPFIDVAPLHGHIDRRGLLVFDENPQGVSEAWLWQARGQLWEEGRQGEARILARDRTGEVVARYALDGACVVGEGYPPMLINPRGGASTPIMITPRPKEWLWAHEHNADKASAPHLIWAAEGVDWRWIAPSMRDKSVKIAHDRTRPEQLAWAEALQRMLWQTWHVKAAISPKPRHHVTPWDEAADLAATSMASAIPAKKPTMTSMGR